MTFVDNSNYQQQTVFYLLSIYNRVTRDPLNQVECIFVLFCFASLVASYVLLFWIPSKPQIVNTSFDVKYVLHFIRKHSMFCELLFAIALKPREMIQHMKYDTLFLLMAFIHHHRSSITYLTINRIISLMQLWENSRNITNQ